MTVKKSDAAPEIAETRNDRELALQIAMRGVQEARKTAAPAAIRRAEEYLATLATTNGRVALGGVLLILQQTIERAFENGADKTVVDAAVKLAELTKLADFSAADVSARTAQSEREKLALQYLESTGVIPTGLDLPEAARLIAQYVIDDVLTRREQNDPGTTAQT